MENRVGSPVSARIAAAPTGYSPEIEAGQLQFVEDRDHPSFGIGELALVVRPVLQ